QKRPYLPRRVRSDLPSGSSQCLQRHRRRIHGQVGVLYNPSANQTNLWTARLTNIAEWVESQGQTPNGVNGNDKDTSQPGTPGVALVGPDGDVEMTGTSSFNREEEVEKLRTSGSM